MEESAEMAKTAIVYKNVADGLDTVEESTDSIISTMKAFGIESDDTMGIIDRFNEVGNNFAITSAGIGEALQRSASALYAGGNTIDESIALVTAANSVIQNPEQVGTALKTLTLRLRGAKVELEEAGLETENMAESTSTLQAKLKALTHGKVDIMLNADTFKNTTQILREMSSVWDEMTDIEQASALELMGGKRQANILASLISNFETVEDVIGSSMNSSGSAMAENAKWMDSIAGKSEQLSNNMQTMWNNTLNSDVVKWFYDLAIGVTDLVKDVGLLPPALAAVLVYFKAFKNIGPISLGKDLLASASSIISAMKQVKSLNLSGFMTASNGVLDASSVKAYANVLKEVSAQQQAAILTSNGFSKAQAAQVLAQNGVEDATIRQLLGLESLNAAKQASTATTAAQAAAMAAEGKVQLSNASADWLAKQGEDQLTIAKVQNAVATGQLTLEQGKEIISTFGLVGANKVASISFKTLGASIKAAFFSNPIGWIMLAVGGLLTLVSVLDRVEDKTDEVISKASEIKSNFNSASNEISKNISTIKGLESEFTALSKCVDENGNNISLTTEDYERYQEIVASIVDMTPDVIEGYDAEGKAIINKNELLERSIELLKEEQKLEAQRFASTDNWKALAQGLQAEIANAPSKESTRINFAKRLQEMFMKDDWDWYNWIVPGLSENIGGVFELQDKVLEYHGTPADKLNTIVAKILQSIPLLGPIGTKIADTMAGDVFYDGLSASMLKYIEYIKNNQEELIKEGLLTQEQIDELLSYELDYYHTDNLEDMVKTYQKEYTDLLFNAAKGTDGFYELNDQQQGFLKEYIDAAFPVPTDGDIESHMYEARENLYGFIEKIADNEDLKLLIPIGYNLEQGLDEDGKSISLNQYKQKVQDFINDINDMTNISDEDKKNILGSFDIYVDGIYKVPQKIQEAEDHVKAIIGSDEWQKYQNTFTTGQLLEIKYYISAEPGSMSVSELRQKLQDIKAELGVNVNSVETYSSIVESIDSINEALLQTSEIITDDTRVTQEYKDALVELGLSERDLADCFYESNPLVVKNADALNALVRDTKKTTAQNIKLAKSQARLEYYEKYKELQKLTNGQKVTTAATLNQVKAIYAEMTALQKSISRYSMLEHQLLGAANAYEEFEKAQEIDAENDYESKAEDLVGYLVDALHTAKLGTESAQAAIKGLVPESVYEDLDTLDEKMAAVYDYVTTDLSKYFYVKFNDDGSLESAEMLIDNVKQFVEDGIGNGVFTGSWEEWDLDPTINSLDELARKMKVTKEVAYAFLQAMETYDISWIGGDASTLLDKLVPTTAQIETVKEQMQEAFNQTPIDLSARVKVSAEKMKEAGYTDFEGDYATVYSTGFNSGDFGFYNADGSTYEILTTPILPNGDVLGKQELVDYINKELAGGKSLNEIDVFLGAYDTVEQANEAAQILHEAQEYYFDMLKNYSLENAITANTQKQAELQYKIGTGEIDADTVVSADGVTTASEQLKQLNAEAEANAQAARENIAEWSDAKSTYDEAAETVRKLNDALKRAESNGYDETVESIKPLLEDAEQDMWDAYEALTKIGEPREVVLTVALEQVEKDLEEARKNLDEVQLSIVAGLDISNMEKDEDGKWIVDINAYSELDDASKAEVQQYLDYLAEEHNINILQGEGAVTTLDVLNEIKGILAQSYELLVEAKVDDSSITTWWEEFSAAPWYKKVSMVVDKVFGGDNEGGLVGVNGTAHASGTAFAGGSWGAPKTETALVGELGPEMLVRNGRWTTIGDNGAEFTQVRKGDIIFNHKQTEDLLSKGYITSRGKLHGSSAFVSGTAYAVHPWTGGMNITTDWQNITPSLWDAATNGEYLSDAMEDAADSVGEFEETIDWIEVRMEEFDERIGKLSAELENLSTYAAKNAKIDEIIAENQKKYADSLAGARYYEEYAQKFIAGMNDDLVAAAKNGAIAITEFTKEQDEATVEAINNYRDYAQKAADLYQQAEEIIADIRNSVIQKIDNIQAYGDAKTNIEDLQTEKLKNRVEYFETKGEIPSTAYYGVNGGNADTSTGMFENSYKTIEYWTPLLEDMQKEFNKGVESGDIPVGSIDWYEQLAKLYEVQSNIDAAKIEIEEFQNSINDLYWDRFDQLINRIEYVKEDTQSLIDLMDSADMVITPETDDGWTADQVEWTKEGMATLGLYAQQMETAEFEAKQYAKAIDDLTTEYEAGHYSENEYLEKLNELKKGQYDNIEAYHEAQDAIKDLNTTRIDAIKNGIEKQIEAYEELISKKKEELDTEKD